MGSEDDVPVLLVVVGTLFLSWVGLFVFVNCRTWLQSSSSPPCRQGFHPLGSSCLLALLYGTSSTLPGSFSFCHDK